ncbi:SDR family oxidoreductase [Microbispora bryophytorum]|uniref:SDR family oxidoreductase n=1 Tax=Microbispora bryophytorum TaxID=1460882 RepID=UPI0033ED7F51
MSEGFTLAGKIALVTGGAGSVGRHITRQLSEAGATVLVGCFHSYDAAREMVAELTAEGRSAGVVRGSVAKPAQVEKMFAEIGERYGRLDILVNNAAAGVFVSLDELTDEHMDRAFATNVKGALWCSRAARPLLVRAGGGAIVNVSSIGASYAPANYLGVGISKAALESLTRYLAAEFARDGIRVNAASAGLIDNEVGRMFPRFDSVRDNTVDATPLGRLASEADLAGLVTFLATPAARWITGQTVVADGGLGLLHRAMSPDPDVRTPDTASVPAPVTAPVTEPVPASVTAPEPAPEPAPELAEDEDPVVVVGMGLAVPGASGPEEFWKLLTEGAELFTEVPADRWSVDGFHHPDPATADKTYQRRSGFMTEFTPHHALAAELADLGENLDYTALWLRHSVHQALDGVRRDDGDRFSVVVGYTPDGSQHLQESLVRREVRDFAAGNDVDPDDPELRALLDRCLPLGDQALPPHRVGRLAVHGLLPEDAPVTMLDTACSSSLYAIDLGVRALMAGEADIAVCGGAFALAPSGSVLFSKLHGLSRRGEVRALDKSADGVLFSDGAGVVVLKRLSRALADGDRVHGVVSGIGLSADGKGKAIYAPSSGGQELAVQRALAKSGLRAGEVDWVIAHATGTPAGDEAEFTGLRSAYAGERPVQVTSNKSLVGHTGWAAGVVSIIHALLALRHGVIPAQYRFTEAPAYFHTDATNLTIPAEPVAWPARPERARTVAVSGFGFGGTNAHLLLQEHVPGLRSAFGYGERRPEPLVLVGWSAHLPGCEDEAAVERWARERVALPASFGEVYPPPPFQKLRMPASAVRATDRAQLMIVECMQRLDPAVRAACDRNRAGTGVVVGHVGPTRNAILYALRAYQDELLREARQAAEPEPLITLFKKFNERVQELIAAPVEDSFPGEMPNVVPARLSNYFDLRGLNIAVDGGPDSLAGAFELAGRYLEFGDIDIALVAGVNGNTLPSWRGLLADSGVAADATEGAFLFAVTRRSFAESEDLPVLAEIDALLEGGA